MTPTEFKDALTKRGFKTVEGRFGAGPHQEVVITKGGTYAMKVTVTGDNINVFMTDGPDLSYPMLDNATFSTVGRPSAYARVLAFIDTYR